MGSDRTRSTPSDGLRRRFTDLQSSAAQSVRPRVRTQTTATKRRTLVRHRAKRECREYAAPFIFID